MTDSISRNKRLTPAEKKAKLDKLRERRNVEYVEVAQLPTWSKLCITKRELYGTEYADLATEFKRGERTIAGYHNSKAGKKLRAEIQRMIAEPEQLAQWLIQSEQAGQALSYLALAETAENTGDLVLAEKIRRTVLQSGGGLAPPKKEQEARPVIVLNVQGGREVPVLEAVEVRTESRLLPKGE